MAQSRQQAAVIPADELTAEEQAQLDEMRQDDMGDAAAIDQGGEAAADGGTAEPGGDDAAATDGGAAQRQQTMVPHGALHEERERRKAVEAQLADARRAQQTLEERTNLLLARMQTPQQQPAAQQTTANELPSVDQDPVGHIVGRLNQQTAVIENIVKAFATMGEQGQASQAAYAVQQRALAAEQEFKSVTPDYDEAVSYLTDLRNKQLIAAGWTDPAERRMMIGQEAMGLANRALNQSQNPATVIYELAKVSGYQPASANGSGNGAANGGGNGTAQPTPAQRLQTAARGQQQTGASLSGVRGAAPAVIDANRIANMSDDEFRKFMDSASPAQLRAVMGE